MSTRFRVGQGYDVHRFAPTSEPGPDALTQMLCGVAVPVQARLLAHSDGDVALHAVTDALLGALALGDLGDHFPDTDERWAGASGAALLGQVLQDATDAGWRVNNADLTLITQTPRIAPYKGTMKARLAELLDCPADCVNVKATTTEGLGALGRREGVAAQAVVSLVGVAHGSD